MVMSALRKLRQKDGCEFKASWSYQVTPCLKTKENYRIAHTKATFILKSKKNIKKVCTHHLRNQQCIPENLRAAELLQQVNTFTC